VKLLNKASNDKDCAWVKIEPGRINVMVPMTPAAATKAKQQLFRLKDLQDWRKEAEAKAGNPALKRKFSETDSIRAVELVATLFSDVPISVDQRHDHITIGVGVGNGEPIRIPCPDTGEATKEGAQDEALIQFAKTLKVAFKEGTDTESILAEFLKSAAKP